MNIRKNKECKIEGENLDLGGNESIREVKAVAETSLLDSIEDTKI